MVPARDKALLYAHSARLRLGKLDAQNFTSLINSFAENGIYYDEFLGILYPSEYGADVVRAAEASLVRLGVTIPESEEDAVLVLTSLATQQMLEDGQDPLTALERLWSDLDWSDTFVVACGLEGLREIYREYDIVCFSEALSEKELAKLADQCREAASIWRREHGLAF